VGKDRRDADRGEGSGVIPSGWLFLCSRHLAERSLEARRAEMMVWRIPDPGRRHAQVVLHDRRRPQVQANRAAVTVEDGTPAFFAYHLRSTIRRAG